VSENNPSFSSRLGLAFATFFRLLFDGKFATQVLDLGKAPTPVLAAVPQAPPTPEPKPTPVKVERDLSPALQLLELLQREGRFIDFVKQDIVSFSDGDVGAAARIVHQGCRQALERIATIDVIRTEPEGGLLSLEAGFDAKAHRLVGNVQGQPPYRGTLKHRGWRVSAINLEEPLPGATFSVVAPAEIEL
jgi:hypothetical protein